MDHPTLLAVLLIRLPTLHTVQAEPRKGILCFLLNHVDAGAHIPFTCCAAVRMIVTRHWWKARVSQF